jgi:hypothetical protein
MFKFFKILLYFLSGTVFYCIKLQFLLHDIRSSETFLYKDIHQVGGTQKNVLQKFHYSGVH